MKKLPCGICGGAWQFGPELVALALALVMAEQW